jgi:hypothetical protein
MLSEPRLEWQSHPFLEKPATSALLVGFLLLLNWILWQTAVVRWHMPFYYYLGMLLVDGNLLPYFIVTRYLFFEDHFIVYYWIIKIQRKYSDFGCYYADKNGITLSTFKLPRRLDPFRGQSLRFSKSRAELPELTELLNKKIGKKY